MTFDENASVRYLMKEMDPSEEVIFEKKMLEDQNLLIEVECFRTIHKRLDELPEIEPPAEVTGKVLEKASRHLESASRTGQMKAIYLSVAATFLLALFGGLFLMAQEWAESSDAAQTSASTAGGGLFLPGVDLHSQSAVPEPESLSPWVDNNDLLHFYDRYDASHASAFDSIFRSSFQKLEAVQYGDRALRPGDVNPGQFRDLHLTGSGN